MNAAVRYATNWSNEWNDSLVESLEVSEDHVWVENVLIGATKHCSEDGVEDRLGRKATQSVGLPRSISSAFQLIVGKVQIHGESFDRIHQHLSTNGFTRLDN